MLENAASSLEHAQKLPSEGRPGLSCKGCESVQSNPHSLSIPLQPSVAKSLTCLQAWLGQLLSVACLRHTRDIVCWWLGLATGGSLSLFQLSLGFRRLASGEISRGLSRLACLPQDRPAVPNTQCRIFHELTLPRLPGRRPSRAGHGFILSRLDSRCQTVSGNSARRQCSMWTKTTCLPGSVAWKLSRTLDAGFCCKC